MSNLVFTAALLLVGIVLALGGMFIYRTGLKLFGVLVGGAIGFSAASGLGLTTVQLAATVLIAAVVGVVLAQKIFRAFIVLFGAITGFFAVIMVTGASLSSPTTLADPVILAGPVVGVVVAVLVQDVIVMVMTAGWGSLLVWLALAPETVSSSLSTQTVPTQPLWVSALAVVGIVAQTGTWVVLRRYDDGELKAKVKGLLGRDSGGGGHPGEGV